MAPGPPGSKENLTGSRSQQQGRSNVHDAGKHSRGVGDVGRARASGSPQTPHAKPHPSQKSWSEPSRPDHKGGDSLTRELTSRWVGN